MISQDDLLVSAVSHACPDAAPSSGEKLQMNTSNEHEGHVSGLRHVSGPTLLRLGAASARRRISQRGSDRTEQRYPLLVSVCDHCGLVQIVSPVDPEILFQDYSFATGTIPGLVRVILRPMRNGSPSISDPSRSSSSAATTAR